MIDVQGVELSSQEIDQLSHPLVGGLILFSRNYQDTHQLSALVQSIRHAAGKPIMIAVDHEGGRVQRFRQGFTRLPPMAEIVRAGPDAEALAEAVGVVMAVELKQYDIDVSFAPVLDVQRVSSVIGDRAFGNEPETVKRLAAALCRGMHTANMPTTGKHFPGHGGVEADSHIAVPIDGRSFEQLLAEEMCVFESLIGQQLIDAVMPAHVIYPNVDTHPAGFSEVWLAQVLRTRLGFEGVIFSDDLSMAGATVAGTMKQRAERALAAGCDMLLVCNDPSSVENLLCELPTTVGSARLQRLIQRPLPEHAIDAYNDAKTRLLAFMSA